MANEEYFEGGMGNWLGRGGTLIRVGGGEGTSRIMQQFTILLGGAEGDLLPLVVQSCLVARDGVVRVKLESRRCLLCI